MTHRSKTLLGVVLILCVWAPPAGEDSVVEPVRARFENRFDEVLRAHLRPPVSPRVRDL